MIKAKTHRKVTLIPYVSLRSASLLTYSRLKRKHDSHVQKYITHSVSFLKVRGIFKVIKVVRASTGNICLAGNSKFLPLKKLNTKQNKQTKSSKYFQRGKYAEMNMNMDEEELWRGKWRGSRRSVPCLEHLYIWLRLEGRAERGD